MPANNDSACVLTHYRVGNVRKLSFAVTFDSGDGSFSAAAAAAVAAVVIGIEGRIQKLVTNPGTPAPTDNYTVTLVDQNGLDVLYGVGANRDTANTESAVDLLSPGLNPVVDESDTLTLTISGNSVHSAQTLIEVTYALGG